ncbi:hypothetical protein [Rhodococcus erythropolis]|uniref:hypothetical protein n=1 Tax=Rhodococcus erythropolis TaxID=1833 RepID=UPI00036E58AB
MGEQQGAFNLAADPPVGMNTLADLFDARLIDIPEPVIRAGLWAAWHAHAVPSTPGLFDTVMQIPTMDCSRARIELGWLHTRSPSAVLQEFFEGLRTGAGWHTPPLAGDGPVARIREIATGLGSRA